MAKFSSLESIWKKKSFKKNESCVGLCCHVALIDYGGTGCMNDDITFVLGSSLSCDGQTFVSDITSSSRWSSAPNLFVSRQTEG